MDSSHLLTHVNAVGCTLERRESSTCGRSLISPLLCQGNEDEQIESIERAVAYLALTTRNGSFCHACE